MYNLDNTVLCFGAVRKRVFASASTLSGGALESIWCLGAPLQLLMSVVYFVV